MLINGYNALLLPWVVHSFSLPIKSTTPLSTLIPGMIFLRFKSSTNGVPSSVFWYKVSWNKITPEMWSPKESGAVNNNWRYLRRFSSVFSTPMSYKNIRNKIYGPLLEHYKKLKNIYSLTANLLPMVPVDSSAAKIPLPGATIAWATCLSSSWSSLEG